MTDPGAGSSPAPAVGPSPGPDVAPAPALTIRPVEPSVWQVYRAVRLAMLLDTPLAYGSSFAREIAFPDELWVERMADSDGWLAFEGELPVGAVTSFHAPGQADDETYLVAMWVASHARGRGVADQLVRALLDHARRAGRRRVLLDVADDNERAIGFYERVGFTRTGRTGELPHQPSVTEFEMELVLGELPVGSG
ncbi:GNAT family N-acetyltransferase [Pedococcus bigeumensis]|uniref:GNAT family N-acetyltransferase n=1 Tax=Pedococcus bigeumensis TaxID=433644 RepID=UPI002FED15B4